MRIRRKACKRNPWTNHSTDRTAWSGNSYWGYGIYGWFAHEAYSWGTITKWAITYYNSHKEIKWRTCSLSGWKWNKSSVSSFWNWNDRATWNSSKFTTLNYWSHCWSQSSSRVTRSSWGVFHWDTWCRKNRFPSIYFFPFTNNWSMCPEYSWKGHHVFSW